MKDKLYKHHKSKKYFLFRRALIFSSIFLLIAATIAIPVGITLARTQTQETVR